MLERAYLALGANEGDRKSTLEKAVAGLEKIARSHSIKISRLYETPALLPERAATDWNRPYLNLVVDAVFDLTPEALLEETKALELELGRMPTPRWSPRPIDIDLLSFGSRTIDTTILQLPHPRMRERAFVLDPLKDLDYSFLRAARLHPQHAPIWMGVLNLTPDSFSDGGALGVDPLGSGALDEILNDWDAHFVGIIDVGAESTRPGARTLSEQEEWERLLPILKFLTSRYQGQRLRPIISVDTYRANTARRAIEWGAGMINDVSGLRDPAMADVLKLSSVDYVLMHSLSVPADPALTLEHGVDPIQELKRFFEKKIEFLASQGIDPGRIWLDPGIGFGKTSLQSLEILRKLRHLSALPYRLIVGHSRKSFLNPFTALPFSQRDLESVGVSIGLVERGVDLLRVHQPVAHIRAFRAWNHINESQF